MTFDLLLSGVMKGTDFASPKAREGYSFTRKHYFVLIIYLKHNNLQILSLYRKKSIFVSVTVLIEYFCFHLGGELGKGSMKDGVVSSSMKR